TTAAINYSSTFANLAANLQAALAALPPIGAITNLAIGGTATAVTVTFQGALANQPIPTLAVLTGSNLLTGGATPSLSVATTTAGVTAFTTLDSGTLTLGGNNALPASTTVNLIGGTLQAS